MSTQSPIILIDDDEDDFDLFCSSLIKAGILNECIWLSDTATVIEELLQMPIQPLIIISDINMPKMTGVELKQLIDDNAVLKKKAIPFVFYTTTATKRLVDMAYTHLNIQGFFEKSDNPEEIVSTIRLILDYWKKCKHPNSIES